MIAPTEPNLGTDCSSIVPGLLSLSFSSNFFSFSFPLLSADNTSVIFSRSDRVSAFVKKLSIGSDSTTIFGGFLISGRRQAFFLCSGVVPRVRLLGERLGLAEQ